MKTCPVCEAISFDDAAVCFGCLHVFKDETVEDFSIDSILEDDHIDDLAAFVEPDAIQSKNWEKNDFASKTLALPLADKINDEPNKESPSVSSLEIPKVYEIEQDGSPDNRLSTDENSVDQSLLSESNSIEKICEEKTDVNLLKHPGATFATPSSQIIVLADSGSKIQINKQEGTITIIPDKKSEARFNSEQENTRLIEKLMARTSTCETEQNSKTSLKRQTPRYIKIDENLRASTRSASIYGGSLQAEEASSYVL